MITFNRYLRPDGDVRTDAIARSPEVERLADECVKRGAVFEVEVLRTGEVSLTSRHMLDEEERDLAGEVVPNGPGIEDAVDRLVRGTHALLFAKARGGAA